MRILLLVHAFNSLSQRLFVELRRRGHQLSVEFDVNDALTCEAVELFQPHLVLAPFLKRAIPESVWRNHCCLVVHPGPPGDRGPSALDRAILEGRKEWGVTVLQANQVLDGGPIWASRSFQMREVTKSSLYRHEVTEAAVAAVLEAVEKWEAGDQRPVPQGRWPGLVVRERPLLRQEERAIHWQQDDTATVLRKIRSADGFPGVRDRLAGRELYLYDAHPAPGLSGPPGALLGRSGEFLCRATRDGAVWIGHLRDPLGANPFKLPTVQVLGEAALSLPELEGAPRRIRYQEADGVGYLHFAFYNGAMGTEACQALLAAYREACRRPTRVLVLLGGPDFWSNGMDLNRIEAAPSPADESWRNINAVDDLAEAILTTTDRITIAALQGNAGAGGVFLARAADRVWARPGVILNPHYKDMGNLYGSEYWTYLLPRHAGEAQARRIMEARLPMGVEEAQACGLVDERVEAPDFLAGVRERAARLAASPELASLLEAKRRERERDEAKRPLASYRTQELERMRLNFYGFDPSYHVARHHFVHKVPKARTPPTLALHRRLDWTKPGHGDEERRHG